MKYSLLISTFAGLSLFVSTPAVAQLTSDGSGNVEVTGATAGGMTVLNFDGSVDGSNVSGLTGQLSLEYLGLVGGDYNFGFTIENTSNLLSRISGIAFNVDPNAVGGDASGVFDNLVVLTNYPNGIGDVDVCLSNNNGSGCSGSGGVWNGTDAMGSFLLDFGNFTPDSISMSDFHVRYQSLDIGSGSGTGNFVPGVPEPATWAMMIIGFGSIGAKFRSRRQRIGVQFA